MVACLQEAFEAAIEDARRKTMEEVQSWKQGAIATPPSVKQLPRPGSDDEMDVESRTPGAPNDPPLPQTPVASISGAATPGTGACFKCTVCWYDKNDKGLFNNDIVVVLLHSYPVCRTLP